VHIGEGEEDLAVQTLGDLPECRGTRAIRALEAPPVETSTRVLMIQEIDETIRTFSS